MATAKPELRRGRAKRTESDGDFYIYVCIKDPGKVRETLPELCSIYF